MPDKRQSAKFCCLLALLGLLLSPVAVADLYKWVDQNGKVHYGNSPPENAKLKKITGKVNSFTSVTVEPLDPVPRATVKRQDSKKIQSSKKSSRKKRKSKQKNTATPIVMYSTSWCVYCKKARAHFRRKKIPFRELDIEKSYRAAREFKRLRGRGVPLILIDDRRMNGFDARTFDKIYHGKS